MFSTFVLITLMPVNQSGGCFWSYSQRDLEPLCLVCSKIYPLYILWISLSTNAYFKDIKASRYAKLSFQCSRRAEMCQGHIRGPYAILWDGINGVMHGHVHRIIYCWNSGAWNWLLVMLCIDRILNMWIHFIVYTISHMLTSKDSRTFNLIYESLIHKS